LEVPFHARAHRARSTWQSFDVFASVRSAIGKVVRQHVDKLDNAASRAPIQTELGTSIGGAPAAKRERRLAFEEGTQSRAPLRGGSMASANFADVPFTGRERRMHEVDAALIAASHVRRTFEAAPALTPALYDVTHI